MSEFKVGDYVVHPKFSNKGLYKIYEISGSITKVQLMPNGRKSYSFKSDIRHATPEEIAAGHRIDKPSNSGELETLDKPENHISPNCKVEELQTQLSLQRQRVKAFEEELTSSRNYGDELQKRVEWLEDRLKATDTLSKMRAAVIGSFNSQEFNARTRRKMMILKRAEQALKGEGQ
ncbi:hypothetical protein CAT22_15780 [Acinetobacter baumannii]|nr:hypothetical protein CAT22_15780 [Acinetobacter baumannii]OVN87369.1 hypothetical protein B9S49_06760 [Acinetobacter baumannii]